MSWRSKRSGCAEMNAKRTIESALPQLCGCAAVGRVEDQAADLGGAVHGGAQAELLVHEALRQVGAAPLLARHLEPVVRAPRAGRASRGSARCRRSARASRSSSTNTYSQRRQSARSRPARRRTSAASVAMRSARNSRSLGQVHRVELRGEREQIVEVLGGDRAQDQHDSLPSLRDAPERLLEHREAALELLVGGVHGQQQADVATGCAPALQTSRPSSNAARTTPPRCRRCRRTARRRASRRCRSRARRPRAAGACASASKRRSTRRPSTAMRPSGPR